MKYLKIELYEKYINGELVGEELESFTRQLQESESMRKEFFTFRAAVDEYFSADADSKNPITEGTSVVKKMTPSSTRSRTLSIRWLIPLAASIVLVLGYFHFFHKTTSTNDLAVLDYEIIIPPGQYGSKHSSIADGDEQFKQMEKEMHKAHKEKNWDQVIGILNPFFQNNQSSLDYVNVLNLYLGNAFLNKKEYAKAAYFLEQVESSVSDEMFYRGFKDLARYQLALAYLGNGNKQDAIVLLEKLTSPSTIELVREKATHLYHQVNQ